MTQTITVKYGEYRNQPIVNQSFELVKGYATGKRGGFVTVKNDGNFPHVQIANVKIKVNNINDITWGSERPIMADQTTEVSQVELESEEDAMEKMQGNIDRLMKIMGNEGEAKELMDEGDTSNAIPYIPKDKSKLH